VYTSLIAMGDDAEVVTLETTNDWRRSVPIGTINDPENHTVSFYGALKAITAWVLTNRPAARLFHITNYNDALNEPGSWGNFKNPNNLGKFQWEYNEVVRHVSAVYGVPVIDVAEKSGLNYYTAQWYTTDGLHLNTLGGKRFAECAWAEMSRLPWGTSRPTAPAGIVVVPATSVTISEGTMTSVAPGGTTPLTAVVAPPTATDKTVVWTSSNPGAATVAANGIVTGVANGSTVITATTTNGLTDTITVTVAIAAVSGVDLAPSSAALTNPTSTVQLTATVLPTNAGNKNVTWSSNNPAVATVNSAGLVSALTAGSATITVTTVSNGFTDTCVVTVTVVAVSGVDVTPSAVTTYPGATTQLVAAVLPSNSWNKSLSWLSSDNTKATVNSSGLVTGVALGSATITATTTDGGFTDTSAVTIATTPEWNLSPQTSFRGIGIVGLRAVGSNPTYDYTLEGVTYGSLIVNSVGHNAIEFAVKNSAQACQITIGAAAGSTEGVVGSFVNFGDNDATFVKFDTFNIITNGLHGVGGTPAPAATTPTGWTNGAIYRVGRSGTRVKIVRVDPGPTLVNIWDGDLATNFPGDAAKYAEVAIGFMGRSYVESLYMIPINCKTGIWTPP
jgi:uncharacterized protein YjdB